MDFASFPRYPASHLHDIAEEGIVLMKGCTLVASPEQAIENILRYQVALADEERGAELRSLMSRVHAWYAVRPDNGRWLFAPSKFVGYMDNGAAAYFLERGSRDGRKTENILRQWFHPIEPGTRQADTLDQALREFLRSHGHSGPRKGARISLLVEAFGHAEGVPRAADRVVVDPSICGGRPHIRNTRVRVCDILQLMASDVSSEEILDDYPYLMEVDITAALEWAAAAVDHRVMFAA